ncbi:MAG: hypothetical protein WC147_09455 [Syntrophomonas sp.]|jgi:hypothetical protein
MDLYNIAYQYKVKANGFDEKVTLIRNVAREMGHPGVAKLAPLIGCTFIQLSHYAQLDKYFEDRKRGRHKRKPLVRVIPEDFAIPKDIRRKLYRWGNNEYDN